MGRAAAAKLKWDPVLVPEALSVEPVLLVGQLIRHVHALLCSGNER